VAADSPDVLTPGASCAIRRSNPQLSQNRPLAGVPQSGHGVEPVPPSGVVVAVTVDGLETAGRDGAAVTPPGAADIAPDATGAPPIGAPHSSQ
jgi:hypothetical protein